MSKATMAAAVAHLESVAAEIRAELAVKTRCAGWADYLRAQNGRAKLWKDLASCEEGIRNLTAMMSA